MPETPPVEGQQDTSGLPSAPHTSHLDTINPFTLDTGEPLEVSLDQVEATLNDLWRHVAEMAQMKGRRQAVTMAQVLNLIVHADSPDAANGYMRETEQITGKHPCRVITTVDDPEGEDVPTQAWVSMYCQIPPAGGRQVCCEQVVVSAGGNEVRLLPAAVLPVLIPDLPVFMWWPEGSPFDNYLFRQIADSLSRLIVDSATFENPEGTLGKMAATMKTNWPHVAMTDMNWGRLTPWREMTAQFFDTQALRPYLDRISHVTVEYAQGPSGTPTNRTQALMFAGWLASRLGWQAADNVYSLHRSDSNLPSTAQLSLRAGKRLISITLVPGGVQAELPGNLHSVKLEVRGESDTAEATFRVTLGDEEIDCAYSSAEVEGSSPTVRNLQMDQLPRTDLLDNELEVFSRDRVYEEALDIVSQFIRSTGERGNNDEGPRKIRTGEPMSAGASRPRPSGGRPR